SGADYLERGELVALLSDYEPVQLGIYAVYATRKQMSPLLRSFLDFLVTRLNDERWSDQKAG
ncbi:MAG: LysR family transcriptional regulator, partial [Gammaproteobacteria bacterium]|nr:LysR family transcriptional regulator [Gammaproteobacteria bacterium]